MQRVDIYPIDVWSAVHFMVAFILCFFINPVLVFVLLIIYEFVEWAFIGEAFYKWNLSGRYEKPFNIMMVVVFGLGGIGLYLLFWG